jgi:hypothetical protein
MTTDTRVRTRALDWKEIVQRSWGKEWTKPEPAYEFTARTFEDNPNGGPYTPQEQEE